MLFSAYETKSFSFLVSELYLNTTYDRNAGYPGHLEEPEALCQPVSAQLSFIE